MENFETYFNKYRYSINGPLGVLYISEPIGWNEDSKTFKRSKEVHGVFSSLSNNLEFYIGDNENDGGYNYLKKIYKEYSINTEVYLLKEEKVLGKWAECYKGYFDFSTYNQNEKTISIMFNESGLYEKIKARNSEEIELDRLTTIDGYELDYLKVNSVKIDGRKIMIISSFDLKNSLIGNTESYFEESGGYTVVGMNMYKEATEITMFNKFRAVVLPLTLKVEQDGNTQTISDYKCNINNSTGEILDASSTSNMFYDESPNNKLLKLNLNVEFNISLNKPKKIQFILCRYNGLNSLEFVDKIILKEFNNDLPITNNEKLSYSFNMDNYTVNLLEKDSLSLILLVENNLINPEATSPPYIYRSDLIINKLSLEVYDETSYEQTNCNFIMPFETLDRIINIIANKSNRLISNSLGRTDIGYKEDGIASLTGITNGFFVRQFKDKKITTSFQDFIDSYKCIWQLGYGIEKVGLEEKIRVEHISHFYKEIVTIKLGSVNNISRKCAKEYFYSSLNIGYSQPSGDVLYEEVLGLDEYNVLNTYITPITKIKNKLLNVSKYRADSYGIEFARRKQKNKFPEEDTKYDLSVMLLDLKRVSNNIFTQRKWEDDFVVPEVFNKETTGIYFPETATNLRFSPANVLKRLGYWIKGCLNKDLDSNITYASSSGNSKLKTLSKVSGSIESSENGNFLCRDLDKALFNPETITFEKEVDTFLMQKVTGSIIIDYETIMNYYGLVEFINEDGYYEYGYLISLEPNNEGKWELLSSSKLISKYSDNVDYNKTIDKPNLNINSYYIE